LHELISSTFRLKNRRLRAQGQRRPYYTGFVPLTQCLSLRDEASVTMTVKSLQSVLD
jgi:hypothetical protein